MDQNFDLNTFLPYRLNRAAEFVSLRFAEQYRKRYRMTRPEWRALAALGSMGRLTATEIVTSSAMHKTKVSRAVSALEKRRWLRRTEDRADRRVEHLELTALGQQSYRELVAMARAYESELAGLLGKTGMRRLEDGLRAVEQAIQGRDPAAGPGNGAPARGSCEWRVSSSSAELHRGA